MMLPSIFGEDLFDTFTSYPFERDFFGKNPVYGKNEKNLMKTDVREKDGQYEIDMDLPGFKKENVSIKLDNGYLLVSCEKSYEKANDEQDPYIRRERWAGSCSRSFYVGEQVKSEDIKAKMEDGILHLSVPKIDKAAVQNNQIFIEG
ncbi:MAG: Hsp20/alpha crystallin family protein [Oscillospiraceae bacterium]